MNKSFDIIGNIAIVKFSEGATLKEKKKDAELLMRKNKHIFSVFEKRGKISGEERIPDVKWIAGKRSSVTLHRENGCVFKVDVRKVFFTPRLSNERMRVVSQIKSGEEVLDMFAGVGPYTIPAAKRAKEVCSIDINRDAVALLKENLKLNHIHNVRVFCGDSKRVVKRLEIKFDQIIMNYPLDAETFLDAAISVLKSPGKIHFYSFVSMHGESDMKEKMDMIRKHFIGKKIKIERFYAGEIAPNIVRTCFDITVLGRNTVSNQGRDMLV